MGKKKDVIKDKKLQSIRNANIIVDIKYSEKKKEYYFYLEMNRILEPAARPRTSSRFSGMYDPLAGYKKHIESVIKEYLFSIKDKNILKIIPYKGPLRSKLYLYKKPNKGDSLKDKFLKIMYKLPLLVKPDLDNSEKTIWDICNGLIIDDDNQIYSSQSIKRYNDSDRTVFKLYFEKPSDKIKEYEGKRLSKIDSEYIKSLYNDNEEE